MNKHFIQIRRGGVKTIIKKLRSFFYLLLQLPIYLISIPLIIILRLIKPWYLIRWEELISGRIGHFSLNTELYCCERDARINSPSQKHLDLFYMKKYVCNKQLEKMWRRSLIILPAWLLRPLSRVNHFFCLFISSFREHEIGYPNIDRDVHNLMDKLPAHISFTNKEELKGKEILKKFGLTKNEKFVCLIVRDSSYLNRYIRDEYMDERWQYHNYRDVDIDKYILAAEELARRGYYVFRMGVIVEKPLKSSNPKVIDYANSDMRSDFMDIYLSANCFFCITTGSGLDGVSAVFRKPKANVSLVPLASAPMDYKENLVLTKHHINKRNQKELTISEIFSANVGLAFHAEKYELNDVELKENTPEEIKDIVIEMDERLRGGWKETKEDLLLQKRFWEIFNNNIKKLNLGKPLHGKIKSRFGAKFLRENQNWIK
jgi:putative glycosyltransferase (TIGR04372 family)